MSHIIGKCYELNAKSFNRVISELEVRMNQVESLTDEIAAKDSEIARLKASQTKLRELLNEAHTCLFFDSELAGNKQHDWWLDYYDERLREALGATLKPPHSTGGTP